MRSARICEEARSVRLPSGGRTDAIVAARQRVLDEAHRRHPERFVRGQPMQKPPAAVWINPPPVHPIADRGRHEGGLLVNSRNGCLKLVDTHRRGHQYSTSNPH